MRILYDGQIYSLQNVGGISRYFANIIQRLPAGFVPLLTTPKTSAVLFPSHPKLKLFQFKRVRPLRVSTWMERRYFRRVTSSIDFDVAHPTYYSLLTQEDLARYQRPVVVTVWDMTHEIFPEHFRDGSLVSESKRKAVEAAQAVICISENTKKDLLERYPAVADRVTVTHLASEIDESMAHGPERIPTRPYFLYVGGRSGYKNFSQLLSAFARASSLRPELALCLVGPPLEDAEKRALVDLKLADRVEFYRDISDAHLAKLYRNSIAFVYPSRYEGFGIPLVEAMACGTAVVAANTSSIPEVVAGAGILFDPSDTDGLTDILLLLADNSAERERLVQLGRQRAREFSWEKTAASTVDIYRSVSR